jgi:hypothetical protein
VKTRFQAFAFSNAHLYRYVEVKEDEIQQIKMEAMRVNKIRENTLNKVGLCTS